MFSTSLCYIGDIKWMKDFHIRCNLPYSQICLSMIAIPKTRNPFKSFHFTESNKLAYNVNYNLHYHTPILYTYSVRPYRPNLI